MASFSKLADLYEELEDITSHNKIVNRLASYLKQLGPEDVRIAAYLALGTIGPNYEDIDLGIGDKFAIRAISSAYAVSREEVEDGYSDLGDLGDVASSFNERKRGDLRLEDVLDQLVKINKASGKGSQGEKISLLADLLKRASSKEARYLMRIALGKLRLGFGEQFLIEALAIAFTGDRENAARIEDTYNICTDIGQLAGSLSEHGLGSMNRFSIKLGRPVKVMLAKRIDSLSELNERFPEEMAAEEKYDGERIQIHVDGDDVHIFSRRLDNITEQFPDLVEATRTCVKAEKAVLDGEVVAYEGGEISSFQKLMQRRRKYELEEYLEKVPVAAFLFDILYLDGRSCLKRSYPERRNILEKQIKEDGRIKLARRIVSSDLTKVQDFFDGCVERGLEGIIVKSVDKDSTYRPGKRGWLWVKWKKEYAEDVRETYDLVVVGSYFGKGKRKGMFGSLLCAALNEDNDRYETFTRVGTGFKDGDFEEIDGLLEENRIDKRPANVVIEGSMEPDRYIDPSIVIEVFGSQVTSSPVHTAGKDGSEKGFALRFPRFLKIRYDKGPEDATTVQEIKELR